MCGRLEALEARLRGSRLELGETLRENAQINRSFAPGTEMTP